MKGSGESSDEGFGCSWCKYGSGSTRFRKVPATGYGVCSGEGSGSSGCRRWVRLKEFPEKVVPGLLAYSEVKPGFGKFPGRSGKGSGTGYGKGFGEGSGSLCCRDEVQPGSGRFRGRCQHLASQSAAARFQKIECSGWWRYHRSVLKVIVSTVPAQGGAESTLGL